MNIPRSPHRWNVTPRQAIEHSLSLRGLKWRIEAWRTGVPYPQIVIKHALVYRVEQVFLIHGETGLLLCHATAENLEAQDADLISGMVTAIRDFVQDSFGTAEVGDGGLRTFSVGERTVLVEQGPKALLAAVVNGQHPTPLIEKLQATLETIHLHFGSALDEFEGDSAPFEAALPLLQECLETVLTTDRPVTRGAAPKVAWAAAGMVVLIVGVLWVVSTVRWNAAVSALQAEPGIVVVEAERGLWGGGRVSGLRDRVGYVRLDFEYTIAECAGAGSGRCGLIGGGENNGGQIMEQSELLNTAGTIDTCGRTHAGKVREQNEDQFFVASRLHRTRGGQPSLLPAQGPAAPDYTRPDSG